MQRKKRPRQFGNVRKPAGAGTRTCFDEPIFKGYGWDEKINFRDLELIAAAGSCTVEWVTAKGGVSFGEAERKRGEIAGAGGDVDW